MSRDRRTALIVGSGLAGRFAAAALARRRWHITLIDDEATDRASAIPAGVMAPAIGGARDPLTRLRRRGLAVTERWLDQLERAGLDAGRIARGALLLPGNERDRARHGRFRADDSTARHVRPAEARVSVGVDPSTDGVLHARGGCIQPGRLTDALHLLHQGTVDCVRDRVYRLEMRDVGWTAENASGEPLAHGAIAVLAAGAGCIRLRPDTGRWLLPARGQATAFRATDATAGLTVPVSGGGYITPAIEGVHWAGATLQPGDTDTAPRPEDDRTNLAFVRERLGLAMAPEPVDRFVGLRATTPNRIPLLGTLADGLWITAGHGAHGLLTAPLCGHLLAHALEGHRHPLMRVLDPATRRDGHPAKANPDHQPP